MLLGFVVVKDGHFEDVKLRNEGGTGPRYAGIVAAEVQSPSDRLVLRGKQPSGGGDRLMVVIQQGAERPLVFGIDDGRGGVKKPPLFWVGAKGDVRATSFTGANQPRPGQTLVQSGTISDGATVPLPGGVNPAATGIQDPHPLDTAPDLSARPDTTTTWVGVVESTVASMLPGTSNVSSPGSPFQARANRRITCRGFAII